MFPFDPPENIRKPKVLQCFKGDQKKTLEKKVKKYLLCVLIKFHIKF